MESIFARREIPGDIVELIISEQPSLWIMNLIAGKYPDVVLGMPVVGKLLDAIEQIAKEGVKNPESCNFTVSVDEITIMQVIQIIPCTDEAINNIESVQEWKR